VTEIGPTLREARTRAGIDITEVERATKIRTKYLRALEDEEWGVLPGPTFAKSFLRTYAEYLGLDARLLVEEFKRRYDSPAEAELVPISPPRQGRRDPRGREPSRRREGLVVLAVLALLLGGLFALGKLGGGSDGGGNTGASGKTDTQARTAPRRPRRPRRRAPARPRRARVELTATGDVYVCAVDGRGRRLLSGVTLTRGGAPRVLTGRRLEITLGNAAVRMTINGRPLAIPASSTPLSYVVTAAGAKPLPAARAPSCA